MSTGVITIEAMKESGYPAELAENVESNASDLGNTIPQLKEQRLKHQKKGQKAGKLKKAYKNQSPDTELFLHAIPPTGIEQTKASATIPARQQANWRLICK